MRHRKVMTMDELSDRLRQMARHTLIETIPLGEKEPQDSAAYIAEFAADILDIRQKERTILRALLSGTVAIFGEIVELLPESDGAGRAANTVQRIKLVLAETETMVQ